MHSGVSVAKTGFVLVPEFSKFEKSNVNIWKEERISSKYREFPKIEGKITVLG